MPEEKLIRTISSYLSRHNKPLNNILDFMCHESKNIYNTSIFHTQIFLRHKNDIFEELHTLVNDNKIKNITDFDEMLYEIYNKYCEDHIKLKTYKIFNNNIIYKFIKTRLIDFIVNDNFVLIEKFVIQELEKQNILHFPTNCNNDTKNKLFHNIVYSILASFYTKNFNMTKDQILAKQKCTIDDTIFIEQVKANNFLLINDKKNTKYKELLKKHALFEEAIGKDKIKSDQNYIARIVYRYYTNPKIASNLMCDIINKAYESYKSFFKLKEKGIYVNIPKFLPKDAKYILPFFKSSFREVSIKNGVEIVNTPNNNNKRKAMKIKARKHSFYRLTVGQTIADDFIHVIDNNDYICLTPNSQRYKKYVHINNMDVMQSGQEYFKKDHFIVDDRCILKDSQHIIDAYYLYFKKPKKLNKDNIIMMEIVPLYDGHRYRLDYKYNADKSDNQPIDDKYISIDLGMKNLMMIHDPNGKQYIIKGNIINAINYYYNNKIDKLKSELAKQGVNKNDTYVNAIKYYGAELDVLGENANYIPKRKTKKEYYTQLRNKQMECILKNNYHMKKENTTSKRIRNLLIERTQRINEYFDMIVAWIMKKYSDCSTIIVGYNKAWKQKVSMGKKNNRDFYEIPYCRLLKKLRDRLERNNQHMVETEESYTSVCDALSMEEVGKHTQYMGKRLRRGLFSSTKAKVENKELFRHTKGKNKGVLINADLNGAINIIRKWMIRQEKPMTKITGKMICNPRVVDLNPAKQRASGRIANG